jgi:hypothetical protein
MAMILLSSPDYQPITIHKIEEAIDHIMPIFPDLIKDELIREIESRQAITMMGQIQILEDNTNHIEWLEENKSSISWDFWMRYEQWLRSSGSPLEAINSRDNITDKILGLLENPLRPGEWDRRGLVVGNVQSGKTANYAALINKAVDSGYKIIIVLAGIHNSLRSQTQLRLDHDVYGYDSQQTRAASALYPGIGVGGIDRRPRIHTLTDNSETGDFRKERVVGFAPGGDPVLLVVKKNVSVLKNVLSWVKNYASPVEGDSQRRVIPNTPILLIDDEADNASIDANSAPRDKNKKPMFEIDPTRTNGLIRQLLNSFEKRSYVGYTATPFANLFIFPSDNLTDSSSVFGGDLFPESFIVNLPIQSNYVGPVQVFGLIEDDEAGTIKKEGYPIVNIIDDYDLSFPSKPKMKKDWVVPQLPDSLKMAIRVFIISCAARHARGQINVHNSMLIHVTRYTSIQEQVKKLVHSEVISLKRRLNFGDANLIKGTWAELEEIWENEFLPKTKIMKELSIGASIKDLTWTEIKPQIIPAIDKVLFKLINGKAKDILDYYEHSKDGLNVIAVGGDKLSRGLTLEGLTVSYYLRHSNMYDTLLQMGRWFGYRDGYVDLCRLYTSRELRDWYSYITLAYEELRNEFDKMVVLGSNPREYGLKVRSHPAGLQITATNKLKHSKKMLISFEGILVETFAFQKKLDVIEQNYKITDKWLRDLGVPHNSYSNKHYIWQGINGKRISELCDSIIFHEDVRSGSQKILGRFILKQMKKGYLTDWTVVLISSSIGKEYELGGRKIGLTERGDISLAVGKLFDREKYLINKNHIISPEHEMIDLTEDQCNEALRLTHIKNKKDNKPEAINPSPVFIKKVRSPQKGLLLIYPLDPSKPMEKIAHSPYPFIGLALSFPSIEQSEPVEYDVNVVYKSLFGEEPNED